MATTLHGNPMVLGRAADVPDDRSEWLNLSRWYLFVLFYGVFSNIPFWVMVRFLRIERNGWFCLDYLCIGILSLFVPRVVTGILMFGSIVADALSAITESYFLSLSECLKSFSSLGELPGPRLGYVIAAVLLAILISVAAALLPKPLIKGARRFYAAGCMSSLAAILLVADCARVYHQTGALPTVLGFRLSPDARNAGIFKVKESRICRLSMKRLIQDEIDRRKDERERHSGAILGTRLTSAVAKAEFPATKRPMLPVTTEYDTPNIVVILVESWGLASNPDFRDSIVRPYLDPQLQDHYRLLQGTVPFYGPTVAGEARELCNSYMGFHLLDASREELRGCLPDRLAALGYHTVGIHGHAGRMFRRSTWYGTIGFQETWFEDRFQQMGLPKCAGGFTGICDADIALWIGNRLHQRTTQPSFLYWVTLNSHLPVPVPADVKGAASCATVPSGQQYPALCSWFQLVSNVHRSIAQIAQSDLSRPTVFVVVGDHAPPFAGSFLRRQFSDAVVPYVILQPQMKGHPFKKELALLEVKVPGSDARASISTPGADTQ
ncbi:MAG TPA: sulfatase-like hydrolase/transferase [Acidobacteriaceae bacterium]